MTFVGSEYLIAYGLLHQLQNGKGSIMFSELIDFARRLQNTFNEQGVDAVVIYSELRKAVYDNPDYFECVNTGNIPYVRCKYGIGKQDLEKRFIGYLPFKVILAAISVVEDWPDELFKQRLSR